jgi:FkbM family methyltransferase
VPLARVRVLMIERLLNIYALLFAKPIFRNLNYLLIQMGLRGIGVLNYRTSYLSGEDLVVRKIIDSLDTKGGVVLDVGANEGNFTELILAESKNLRVLSFEPHPKTCSRLRQRFAKSRRVKILNCAVGNKTGEISLFDCDEHDGSQHASVFKDVIENTRGKKAKEYKVDLITLDSLRIEGDVQLIKLDVEGFELSVLQGAKKLINDKRPRFMVIEFNEMNINAHTFLSDITKELAGYRMDRILPGGQTLELNKPYRPWTHEIFAYQNLLFTRS